MSDEYTLGTQAATRSSSGDPGASKDGRGKTNKAVTLLIALGVLAVVVGVAAAIVLAVMGGPQEDVEVRTPGGSTPGKTSAPSGQPPQATDEAAPAVSNAEVFTFRDIFEPLLKPLPKPPAPSDNETDTATPSTPGTLYLNDIITDDGVLKAVLELDDQTYTLAAGGTITGTPWKVLKVTSTQVTMLYGDTQVTLTIGQGITK